MEYRIKWFFLVVVAVFMASCTGHRTASEPEPDGDTIEVVIINSTQDA